MYTLCWTTCFKNSYNTCKLKPWLDIAKLLRLQSANSELGRRVGVKREKKIAIWYEGEPYVSKHKKPSRMLADSPKEDPFDPPSSSCTIAEYIMNQGDWWK